MILLRKAFVLDNLGWFFMAPTMSDVASKANVSSALVSRVFSKDSVIPEETAARVIKAAQQLGYRLLRPSRSSLGRRLISHKVELND